MELWRPASGHPAWPSTRPVFQVRDGCAHPMDREGEPWFRIDHNLVYRAAAHPDGPSTTPEYRIIGNYVYPADTPSRGPAFEIVDRP
jgi:hypothetical protein